MDVKDCVLLPLNYRPSSVVWALFVVPVHRRILYWRDVYHAPGVPCPALVDGRFALGIFGWWLRYVTHCTCQHTSLLPLLHTHIYSACPHHLPGLVFCTHTLCLYPYTLLHCCLHTVSFGRFTFLRCRAGILRTLLPCEDTLLLALLPTLLLAVRGLPPAGLVRVAAAAYTRTFSPCCTCACLLRLRAGCCGSALPDRDLQDTTLAGCTGRGFFAVDVRRALVVTGCWTLDVGLVDV